MIVWDNWDKVIDVGANGGREVYTISWLYGCPLAGKQEQGELKAILEDQGVGNGESRQNKLAQLGFLGMRHVSLDSGGIVKTGILVTRDQCRQY